MADTNATPGGNRSCTVTFVAVSGPRFDTVTVHVKLVPIPGVAVLDVFVSAKSASGPAVTVALAVLLVALGSNWSEWVIDLFIMREPLGEGHIVGVPGTEGYRAGNSGEPLIVAVALDHHGRARQARSGAAPRVPPLRQAHHLLALTPHAQHHVQAAGPALHLHQDRDRRGREGTTAFRSLSIKPSFSAGRTELLFARSLSQVRQAIRAPEFGGASVTIPLKVAVIPLLDHVTDIAHKIGAVNTIFRDKDGSVLNNI